MRPPPTILVVDDEQLLRWALRQRLEADGYHVVEAATGADGLERFAEGVDLVLLDYRLPDTDGLTVLRAIRQADTDTLVVMLTAHSSVERAVEAMRDGAYHYLRKPIDMEQLAAMVRVALETTRLRRELRGLRASVPTGIDAIVGESPAIVAVKRLVEKVAASAGSTILVTGESGTGKDVVARTVHRLSPRREFPFVNITCSALPEPLLESELFGHERGAFTDARQQKRGLLERADGGTVFLDEIGEMAPALQAKMLRFLEEKTFRRVGGTVELCPDVRVVAATNRELGSHVASGQFREDLYYRLAVLHVHLPPLRERPGDVELLVRVFVDSFSREFHKKVTGVRAGAMRMLAAHGWPGNVRELKNTLERAVLLSESPELDVRDFEFLEAKTPPSTRPVLPPEGVDLRELERQLVVLALERSGGSQTRAAALLGLNRDQIRYRIAKFGLGK